jgi:hypothetical protein
MKTTVNYVVYTQEGEWMGSYSTSLGAQVALDSAITCAKTCEGSVYENTKNGNIVWGAGISSKEGDPTNPLDDMYWGSARY